MRSNAGTLLVVVLLVVGGVAGPVSGATTGASAEGDWHIDVTIDIQRDGTATVTKSVNRSVGRVELYTRRATDLEFQAGSDAVEPQGSSVHVWYTGRSQQITYTLQLGGAGEGSGTTDDAVYFRIRETAPSRYFYADTPPVGYRYTVNAPEGWEVAMDGRRVGENTFFHEFDGRGREIPRDFAAVGDFEMREWTVDGETYRLAVASTEEAPDADEVRSLLRDTAPVVRSFLGSNDTAPKLAIVAPSSVASGGIAKRQSMVLEASAPLYDVENGNSVYVHEQTHMYQEWGGTYEDGIGDWGTEGSATYLQHYGLYAAGAVTESEFVGMLRADVTTERGTGEPLSATAAEEPYFKGEAVWAALDLDIRARTDGEHTLADVFARVNYQTETSENGFAVTPSELLAALEAVTGHDYTNFYETFVESTAFPVELLAEDYSLAEPTTVDPGPVSRTALRNRLENAEETIERQETLLERRNETVREQRETIERREELLERRNETVADLRKALNGSGGTATTDTDGDGVPDGEDYAPRDADVQERSDIAGSPDGSVAAPGLGAVPAAAGLALLVVLLARRRR